MTSTAPIPATPEAPGRWTKEASHPLVLDGAELLGVAVVVATGAVGSPSGAAVAALGTAAIGIGRFWHDGGSRFVTASGTYYLAEALFGGLAGLLILSDPAISYYRELGYAIAIIAFTTSLIGFVARLARGPASPVSERRPARVVITPNLARLGLTLSFLGLLLLRLSSQLSPFADALAYSGVVLCMIAVFPAMRDEQKRSASHSLLAALSAVVALIVYLSSFFEGFGRLNLATLGLIAAALAGWVARRRYLKLFVVLAIGPFLILAASIGENRGPQPSAAARSSFIEEVGSVNAPTLTMADVLRMKESGQLSKRNAYGGTFITAAAAWVPGGIWPNKPPGFGRLLIEEVYPHRAVSKGDSTAAAAPTEWIYNFGWIGLPLMIGCVGVAIGWLDKRLSMSFWRSVQRPDWFRLAIGAVVTSGMMDFFWTGSFTFAARAGLRCVALAAAYYGARAVHPRAPPLSSAGSATRNGVAAGRAATITQPCP
jgi:hypothetical protein